MNFNGDTYIYFLRRGPDVGFMVNISPCNPSKQFSILVSDIIGVDIVLPLLCFHSYSLINHLLSVCADYVGNMTDIVKQYVDK